MHSPAPHPDLPDGYVARPVSLEDADAAAVLLNAYSQAFRGEDDVTSDELRLGWSSPGFDLATDSVIVTKPDGAIVACADFWDTLEPHVRTHAWCRVHPDHRGRGLGTWALEWIQARARKALDRAPTGARVVMLNSVIEEDAPAHRLLEDRGWNQVRSFYTMRIDFDGAPDPAVFADGITVRTFRAGEPVEDLARTVDDCFSDHWGHVPAPMEEMLEHWRHWIEEDPTHDPSLWLLAESDGRIAGMSLCSLEAEGDPERGWCHTLGVRREWRRKGLGLALLTESFGELHRRGKRGVGLGVDASSLTGATRLYEKAGMYVARQSDTYELLLRNGEDLAGRDLT